MKRTLIVIVTVFLFLTGSVASGLAYSHSWDDRDEVYAEHGQFLPISENFDDLFKFKKIGEYDYADALQQYIETGTGDYVGTGRLENYGDQNVKDFFTNSGFTDITQIAISYFPGDDAKSGWWDVTYPGDVVQLLMVKGGTSFSIHEYDPLAIKGLWDVGHLYEVGANFAGGLPDMSFVRAYKDTVPVPEPGLLLLLGSGLIGLAAYGRRKING